MLVFLNYHTNLKYFVNLRFAIDHSALGYFENIKNFVSISLFNGSNGRLHPVAAAPILSVLAFRELGCLVVGDDGWQM